MTNYRDEACPDCGLHRVVYYTLGAPGIGGGWWCEDCGWDEPNRGNRILRPEETR